MLLTRIEARDVLIESRRMLGLAADSEYLLDAPFLAGLIRHCAGFLCPCSPATLRSAALESLQHLSDDKQLAEQIDDTIEGLLVGGDLLELHQVATDDGDARGTWVFAAPPTFVVRPSGKVFLTGVVRDQDTYLPEALRARIRHEGYARVIAPEDGEELVSELSELGLQRLSQETWLKSPKKQPAIKQLESMKTKLASQADSGGIADLQILDPARSVTYYRGRWVKPKKQSGTFVARRPQEYGAPIWCFVELQDGEMVKLLDFPLPRSRWRGCDAAWHLQCAIDSCNGTPQRYRIRPMKDGARLDLFSPLPLWAQRRLMILGRPLERENSLFSYWIPSDEVAEEERFLKEAVWLGRETAEGEG